MIATNENYCQHKFQSRGLLGHLKHSGTGESDYKLSEPKEQGKRRWRILLKNYGLRKIKSRDKDETEVIRKNKRHI